jgi:hypothetical protein
LPSEFDPFLFALINGEQTGIPVSVLSALARSDLDPWEEAAKLARLSQQAATESLASTITALRGNAQIAFDPKGVASRLVALLPRSEALASQQSKVPTTGAVRGNEKAFIFAIIINGLIMAFVFGHPAPATNSPQSGSVKETHAALSTSPPASNVIAHTGDKVDGNVQKPRL